MKITKKIVKLLLAIILLSGLLGGIIGSNLVLTDQLTTKYKQTKPLQINQKVNIPDIIKDVSPSVVSVVSDINIPTNDILNSNADNSETIGSGFVIKSDGLIITANHVVGNTHITYYAITKDNKILKVEQIKRDQKLDLALLKVNSNNLHAIKLGNSDSVQQGQTVIAIGNPFGSLANTVTVGVISGINRSIIASDQETNKNEYFNNLIQTDAAINPGNSGGPLLNSDGQVIGINVAGSEFAQSIGFAIPINQASKFIKESNNN